MKLLKQRKMSHTHNMINCFNHFTLSLNIEKQKIAIEQFTKLIQKEEIKCENFMGSNVVKSNIAMLILEYNQIYFFDSALVWRMQLTVIKV